jgi:hypothetical protein
MKIKIFIILLLLTTVSYAYDIKDKLKNEDKDICYIQFDNAMNLNISNGIYSPFLGIGVRQTFGKNGFDWNASLELYPLIKSKFKLASYNINGNYIRYMKNARKNKLFFGGGASVQGIYTPYYFYLLRSPTFIFGKQIYEGNKIYIIQLKINWPNWPNIWLKDYFYRIPKREKSKRIWAANVFITTALGF